MNKMRKNIVNSTNKCKLKEYFDVYIEQKDKKSFRNIEK